jgi:hypothetical protein
MSEFLAFYRGPSIAASRLVAVTAEPELVRRFKTELLDETELEVTAESKDHTATRELEVVRD